jgi:hypothetical protein
MAARIGFALWALGCVLPPVAITSMTAATADTRCRFIKTNYIVEGLPAMIRTMPFAVDSVRGLPAVSYSSVMKMKQGSRTQSSIRRYMSNIGWL